MRLVEGATVVGDALQVQRSGWHATAALVLVLAAMAGCSTPTSPVPSTENPASPAAGSPPAASSRLRLVIDTDMAPDDIVAIASLLRDPAVDVLAITVVGTGEAHCQGGLFVARSIVTMLLETPPPVACGRMTPFGDAEPFPDEWRAGADTGNGLALVSPSFAPDPRSSAEILVELAAMESAAGRRLTILTVGTLTNLASALELDPTLPSKVEVVSMLGAVGVAGNVTIGAAASNPTAEWNAHADPTAVRRVLEGGFDLTLVPLDATNSVPLTRDLVIELEADHAAGPADLVYELWARNPFMAGGGLYLWDPLAAAAVRDPSIVTTRPARVRVIEGDGPDGGRLVEDPAGAAVTIAVAADRERFETFLLASLRIGGPRSNAFAPVGTIDVVAGEDTCDVTLEPVVLPEGLVKLVLTSTIHESTNALAFGTAGVAWADLEAFVREPDFEHPPPTTDIASAFVEGPGTAAAWGDARAGPLGVACLFGSFDDPSTVKILLRGPFELAE